MTKLLIWIGVCVGGWIGWYLGDLIGGFGWAFTISSLGSIVGVFIGWKISQNIY